MDITPENSPITPPTEAAPIPAEAAPAPTDAAPAPLAPPTEEKKKRGRKKGSAPKAERQRRAPAARAENTKSRDGFKDWIRVEKSQGSGLVNEVVKLTLNTATKVLTISSQARVKADGPELESPRIQKFRFTDFEVTDVVQVPEPVPEPVPAPAPEPAPAPAPVG